MSDRRPFREVKLQWLQALSCDGSLSDCAKTIALYIVTTHMNGHTEKAWPSYQTIADATGKSVKTIQRAVRELEERGWFDVQRGNGVRHNTVYSPTEASITRAIEAREKADKVVPLRPEKGGQNCPQRGTNLSPEGGQNCPPNLEKKKINKPNAPAREAEAPLPASEQADLKDALRDVLGLEMDETAIRLWVETLTSVTQAGNRMIVTAPSRMHCDWIEQRFAGPLSRAAQQLVGPGARVVFRGHHPAITRHAA
ncbi:helix-turn-helix domain-containing protein [Insolitispirillum peregrinum]|uniref:helix-turn-helix domain-containing protein n=1 Tax=Insolitispirillum peregrinum TaxID=80876 RepID=UPI003613A876